MRLLFMGYSNIGHTCLKVLIDLCRQLDDNIVAVVTHEDNPQEQIWFRSVQELALAHNLPVYTPEDPNNPEFVELLRGLAPDFIFSCYYRKMLKKAILNIPPKGALNLHGSLLPRYRGRCPINWVLLHGEPLTGLTLHYMEEKPDYGDMVAQVQVPIIPEDTALTLSDKMAIAAGTLMRQVYPLLRVDLAPRIMQDHNRATYFGGRKPEDGRIDWEQPAVQIYNLIRAVTHPFPGAFTFWRGKRLFLWAGRPKPENQGPLLQPGEVALDSAAQQLVIGAGQGRLAVIAAQLEGSPEVVGEALVQQLGFLAGEILGRS
ncbi:formyltransferase [Desulfobacca acetoxidans]|uniref:Methionyl-tRNA formyltransferase n=1 Tax=Desulfobacca acetoxidans (strain ATCC 700848 / DSM 11109 / ASRB2) TaxID=880072 RepID=F2NIT8_DESAR|nr:formyltransferase [Desulfobacca acetoxidans]AEB10632.1 Methionyl-tRNA formyltransferase [Desulfobacca acetoxidans DSM 11109]